MYFNVSSTYGGYNAYGPVRQKSAELWRTDGTREGTYLVTNILEEGVINFWRNAGDQMLLKITYETHDEVNGYGFERDFYHYPSVAISDGTKEGTQFINSFDFKMVPRMYFPAIYLGN